ncbi:MAG: aldehyde dehydrogenase family protein [Proteobacteria bacterium]|nr:aldehyde dehydrogenase family protein [Pseudomonadota bacterium]
MSGFQICCGGSTFFSKGGVLLCHLIHLVDCITHLQDATALFVEIGRAQGATLVTGGSRVACHTGSGHEGFFMATALLVDAAPDMRINREEIYGPREQSHTRKSSSPWSRRRIRWHKTRAGRGAAKVAAPPSAC